MLRMVERRGEGTRASDDTGELVHLSGWLPEDLLLGEKHKSLLLIGKDGFTAGSIPSRHLGGARCSGRPLEM